VRASVAPSVVRQRDAPSLKIDPSMASPAIQLELLPDERHALLQWNFTPEVRSQLEACAASDDVESIIIPRSILRWLTSDLNHAIVKRGCRDEVVIELAERLEYVEESGDGSLDSWH
jgi:hypothetical protein